MAEPRDVLIPALEGYTGAGLNDSSILTQNVDGDLFTIVAMGYSKEKRFVFTALIYSTSYGRYGYH